ncbi:hypothetical protein D9M68_975180 [compost metagenome]
MAFRRQVHDEIDSFLRENPAHLVGVADIGFPEDIVRTAVEIPQRRQVACVGQLVQIDDTVLTGRHEMPAHGRADETGTAGDQHSLRDVFHG